MIRSTNPAPPNASSLRERRRMTIVGPDRLDEVVDALNAGRIVAIPTDTVYGLAARANDAEAVRGLGELKGRDARQPVAVLFDDVRDIDAYVRPTNAFVRLSAHWPGPLTLVVRVRHASARRFLATAEGTVGVRQPADELARAVLRRVGGVLAVTSANFTGEPPATTAQQVAEAFGPALLVLDGGPRVSQAASTVVDVADDEPRILRAGPLTAADLGIEG
jgi:tRNA threonylcarbamoyl adenosine modification protein (Sua5/YciO/YrdC/YwlC family)